MKRYCLTDCATQKLSKGWKNTIKTVVVILALITLIITVTVITFGVGYITYHGLIYFGIEMKEITRFSEYGPLGSIILATIGVIGFLLYWLGVFFMVICRFFRNVATNQVNKYQGNDYEKCKIFEECKDETDEV